MEFGCEKLNLDAALIATFVGARFVYMTSSGLYFSCSCQIGIELVDAFGFEFAIASITQALVYTGSKVISRLDRVFEEHKILRFILPPERTISSPESHIFFL